MVHAQFPPDPDEPRREPAPLPTRRPVCAVLLATLPATLLLLVFALALLLLGR